MKTSDPNDPNERFDGAAWAATLPAHVKERICAAAFELRAVREVYLHAGGTGSPVWQRLADESWRATLAALVEALHLADLPENAFDRTDGVARLPSMLGRVCMTCGGVDGHSPPDDSGRVSRRSCLAYGSRKGA